MSFNAFDIAGSGMTAQRVKMDTIASNIANINTPNYKRKYVKFEETLNNANKTGKIEVKTDTSGAVRNDGNNVDLESEKVNQAANTLMYNGLISLTNSKLSMAKSVITGR